MIGAARGLITRFVDIQRADPDHRPVQSRAQTLLVVVGLTIGGWPGLGIARAGEVVVAKPASALKFRVEPMGPATLATDFAERLATAAGAGLTAAGADVLPTVSGGAQPSSPSPSPSPSPSTPDYLLRGTCAVEGSTYRLHLELVDARTNAVTVGRDDLCEICTETEVAEATNVAASALKVALERSLRTPAPAPKLVLPAKPAPRSVQPRGIAPWRRAVPWVAFGVGAAALGAGVYYLAIEGRGTDYDGGDRHGDTQLYDQTWHYALPCLAVGAAAVVVGILTLPRAAGRVSESSSSSPPQPSPAPRAQGLTLTPRGLAAWGTF